MALHEFLNSGVDKTTGTGHIISTDCNTTIKQYSWCYLLFPGGGL